MSVHKQQREEAISEALDELNHAFPRLQILEEITPKPKLHSLVAEIYSLVISFARETTEYFQRSSLGKMVAFMQHVFVAKSTLSRTCKRRFAATKTEIRDYREDS